MTITMGRVRTVVCLTATFSLVACVGKLDLGELEDTESGTGGTESGGEDGPQTTGGDGGTDDDTAGSEDTGNQVPGPNAVDVLFVIDNSGSMGLAQAALAQGATALIESLESEGIDYRLAFTTTDNGNPWCTGTTPEAGDLRLSSCRSRQSEFVFMGASIIDNTQEACLDLCAHDSLDILPTPTHLDPTPTARPWIEGGPAGTNVGPGMTVAEAATCAIPQGINGCGFEQPLESLYKALLRFDNAAEGASGFMRPDAHLAVVFVSDEIDCSHQPALQEIFLPEGNKVFWSLPAEGSPTSAVCWNAGVQCTGGPGEYDECHAENYDIDGNPGVPDADAVLFPLSRYQSLLSQIAADKAPFGGDVMTFAITGVPQGYPGTPIVYADGVDPQFKDDFGIGASCSSAAGEAVPPVRIRETVEAFSGGDPALYSVCSGSFASHLSGIAGQIVEHVGS